MTTFLQVIILVAIAILAPFLGTVDPTLFDAASRDLLPGKAGEITTLEGETIQHTFLMGSDSFGRDIYSRVLYGTRISLLVGVCTALVALAATREIAAGRNWRNLNVVALVTLLLLLVLVLAPLITVLTAAAN